MDTERPMPQTAQNTSLKSHKQEEKEIVERLSCALRDNGFYPLPWKTCCLKASERPDFATSCDGSSAGIEVTVLHVDDSGNRSGGSALRKKETQIWKATVGSPYSNWGSLDFLAAFEHRVREKVAAAASYKFDGDLWLVVAAQLPVGGAVVSTFVVPFLVDTESLNQRTHKPLENSRFKGAFLYLMLTRGGNEDEGNPLDVLQDPDWLSDPSRKAREEALKFIAELRAKPPLTRGYPLVYVWSIAEKWQKVCPRNR